MCFFFPLRTAKLIKIDGNLDGTKHKSMLEENDAVTALNIQLVEIYSICKLNLLFYLQNIFELLLPLQNFAKKKIMLVYHIKLYQKLCSLTFQWDKICSHFCCKNINVFAEKNALQSKNIEL